MGENRQISQRIKSHCKRNNLGLVCKPIPPRSRSSYVSYPASELGCLEKSRNPAHTDVAALNGSLGGLKTQTNVLVPSPASLSDLLALGLGLRVQENVRLLQESALGLDGQLGGHDCDRPNSNTTRKCSSKCRKYERRGGGRCRSSLALPSFKLSRFCVVVSFSSQCGSFRIALVRKDVSVSARAFWFVYALASIRPGVTRMGATDNSNGKSTTLIVRRSWDANYLSFLDFGICVVWIFIESFSLIPSCTQYIEYKCRRPGLSRAPLAVPVTDSHSRRFRRQVVAATLIRRILQRG